MEEGRKHIDDLFREELQGYHEMPDPAVWNSIEQRLPGREGKRSFLWLWILLMLALMSSLGYYVNRELVFDTKKEAAPATHFGITNKGDETFTEKSALKSEPEKESGKGIISKDMSVASTEKVSEHSQTDEKYIGEVIPDRLAEKAAKKTSAENSDTHNATSDDRRKPGTKTGNNQAQETGKRQNYNARAVTGTHPVTGKTNLSSPDVVANNNLSKTSVNSIKENQGEQTKEGKNNPGVTKTGGQIQQEKQLTSAKKGPTIKENPANPMTQKVAKKDKTVSQNDKEINKAPITPIVENKVTTSPENKVSVSKAGKTIAGDKRREDLTLALKNTDAVPPLQNGGLGNTQTTIEDKPAVVKDKIENTKPAGAAKAVAGSAKQEKPDQPVLKKESTGQGYQPDPEIAKGNPIPVEPETAKGERLNVNGTGSKGNPIELAIEPNAKKSKIDVSYQDAQGKPLTVEPAKEYGVKLDEVNSGSYDVEGKTDVPKTGEGAGGGGGAGQGNFKKGDGLKFDAGIKAGYERGFSDPTSSNITGNAFIQWNVSPKVAVILQPGVRYASVGKTGIFSEQSFHEIINQSLDSSHVFIDSIPGTTVPGIQRNYTYKNTYDSIYTSFSMNSQRYLEVELPLLLQYHVADNFSLLGGFQLAFGKVLQIGSDIRRVQNLTKADSISFPAVPDTGSTGAPSIPSIDGYFNYQTPSFSTFDENKYKNPATNPARFGLMLGFSYEVRKRLLIDVMMRKNVSSLNFIPNEQIRKIYNQPYFRITIGYKLFQSK